MAASIHCLHSASTSAMLRQPRGRAVRACRLRTRPAQRRPVLPPCRPSCPAPRTRHGPGSSTGPQGRLAQRPVKRVDKRCH
eukprot:356376-Chlamydomonas_euryale.AAC.2